MGADYTRKTDAMPRMSGSAFGLDPGRSGSPPSRRTRRHRAFALSALGMLDTARNAPPGETRLGLASRRRNGGDPPLTASRSAFHTLASFARPHRQDRTLREEAQSGAMGSSRPPDRFAGDEI